MPSILQRLIGTSLPLRILATAALCIPMGGVLGAFFPCGIRRITAVDPGFTPWTWAVNGCLTVVGSVVTIILATAHGFDAVMLLFIASYVLGAVGFLNGHARLARGITPGDPERRVRPRGAAAQLFDGIAGRGGPPCTPFGQGVLSVQYAALFFAGANSKEVNANGSQDL